MKSIKVLLFLMFAVINYCHGQDTLINLSPSMFVGNQEIPIATMNGWIFREGHDTVWAAKDINIAGWKKFRPADLSAENADKNGRAEGWFRLRVKPDMAFGDVRLDLRFYCWAAADLFIDGKFVRSFGNTGVDGNPFQEFNPNERLPIPVDLTPGKEHLIAFHFVDWISPFPGQGLKSQRLGLQQFIKITGPYYYDAFAAYLGNNEILLTVQLSVSAILCLLFWLLALQNSREHNLWLIAVFTTLSSASIFFNFISYGHAISFVERTYYDQLQFLCQRMGLLMVPLIILNVFKRKLVWDLKTFLVYSGIGLVATIIFPNNFLTIWYSAGVVGAFYFLIKQRETLKSARWANVVKAVIISSSVFLGLTLIFTVARLFSINPFAFWNTILIAICAYYVSSSWKTIKGAQWVIVAGLILTVLWSLAFVIANNIYKTSIYPYNRLYTTGTLLSFPLSLLIYVALRFKEHIEELNMNAEKVLQLSEEKKEQALNQQKILQEEVNRQTAEIRNTLDNLKATQHQLIQSEKMASLGELTAGIAHEIQNPLNFVNNFSEVNSELIHEMKKEIDSGNLTEAKTIASTIDENEQKITFHGKRADAIVKGMLQHSRSSSGTKEPTDINALADEYLRLAYHGLRAKDKSFNATMKTDYDPGVGTINIIPQDIGRVILNLITNAFYAVTDKSASAKAAADKHFEPTVWVSTKKIGDQVLVSIKDNGMGIPKSALDKIFQPFFTTKPTGKGTGLGLSLSYDIVKAHGGQIKVSSNLGDGAEFTVTLPTSKL